MECQEAQPFVSVLYDGRRVPEEAAEHIRGCAACRRQLHDYAAIGAEMKLVGNRPADSLPVPAWLASAPPRSRFLAARALTARVMIPRYAVGLVAGVIIALSIGLNLIRAQGPALWFQFQIGPADSPSAVSHPPHVVKSGDRKPTISLWPVQGAGASPSVSGVGVIVSVLDIQSGRVRVAARARHYPEPPSPESVEHDIGDLKGHDYAYVPGQTLEIPIEGGGTVLLSGQVFEQQPKLAWNLPLDPAANQLILRNFALIRDKEVLSPVMGWCAIVEEKDKGISLYLPGQGLFTFALQPFEGAVKGEANWSQAKFKIGGHHFDLLSGAQITGGDQPRDIWVSLKADYVFPIEPDRGRLGISQNLPGVHN